MTSRAPNGHSKVTKGKDGKWHGWLDFGTDPQTGRRRRKHVAHQSRVVAEQRLQDSRQQLDRRGATFLATPKPKTVAQWLKRWLAEEVRQIRTPFVRAEHREYVKDWLMPHLGEMRLSRLSRDDIVELVEQLPTLAMKAGCLDTVFLALRHAEDRGYVDGNVAQELRVEPILPSWLAEPDDPDDETPFDPGQVCLGSAYSAFC